MEQKSGKGSLIIITIFAFFLGAAAFYGLIKIYPTVVLKEVTKLDKKVTITDNGIAESVDKVYDSVVVVSTYTGNTKKASGTGFVYKNGR